MAKIVKFEELFCWQQARSLYNNICRLIDEGRFGSNFRFKDQIEAAAGSIMDNIAEGFERSGKKEFRQFLFIAKGSCGELRSQLYRCLDRRIIAREEFESLLQQANAVGNSIQKLIKYLNQYEHNGDKYI